MLFHGRTLALGRYGTGDTAPTSLQSISAYVSPSRTHSHAGKRGLQTSAPRAEITSLLLHSGRRADSGHNCSPSYMTGCHMIGCPERIQQFSQKSRTDLEGLMNVDTVSDVLGDAPVRFNVDSTSTMEASVMICTDVWKPNLGNVYRTLPMFATTLQRHPERANSTRQATVLLLDALRSRLDDTLRRDQAEHLLCVGYSVQ